MLTSYIVLVLLALFASTDAKPASQEVKPHGDPPAAVTGGISSKDAKPLDASKTEKTIVVDAAQERRLLFSTLPGNHKGPELPVPGRTSYSGSIGASNPCVCKEQWSIADYENCGVTQKGCAPTACDGDTSPWCNIKNSGCDEEVSGQGWAYCTPTPAAPNPCVCEEEQWSCADHDDDDAPWCNIKNSGCDEEVSGQGWAYCTDTSLCSSTSATAVLYCDLNDIEASIRACSCVIGRKSGNGPGDVDVESLSFSDDFLYGGVGVRDWDWHELVIGADAYVETVEAGVKITTNRGLIGTNLGVVGTNFGKVELNWDEIDTNYGDVTTNDGNIGSNLGSIDVNEDGLGYNWGVVTVNSGWITFNGIDDHDEDSIVTTNDGTIEVNHGDVTNCGTGIIHISPQPHTCDSCWLDVPTDGRPFGYDAIRSSDRDGCLHVTLAGLP